MRSRVVLTDLDLDATSGSELGNDDGVDDLAEVGRVSLTAQTIVERVQIRSGDNVGQMSGLSII